MYSGYCNGYSEPVEQLREREYPALQGTTYLDHAGTTLYAKSLVDSFSHDLTTNLLGNPHSMSASSQLSARRIDDIRLRALRFFNADPEAFDLVFVANATAAIKLVADAMRDMDPAAGFWYGYHVDAHTSLVGVRGLAEAGSRCFLTDRDVEAYMSKLKASQQAQPRLLAFPAQSNMNGRRLPFQQWCQKIRQLPGDNNNVFTLLDAASLVSTVSLDLRDVANAPDFTALSFYKIFGFPDLGALIVRKDRAARVFERRKYFGGGTVDMVTTVGMEWHAAKETSIHDRLEDGTLPFHSIVALDSAFDVHGRLYGTMNNVSVHTRFLAGNLHQRLSSLRHANGTQVCDIYKHPGSDYSDPSTQGPIVSFNLRNSSGEWIGKSEVERLAAVKNIEIRSGTLCNPGGTASWLGWTGAEQRRNFSSGLRCGDDHDVMEGRPTGILRVSLGAMSSMADIDTFVGFVDEFYVERSSGTATIIPQPQEQQQQQRQSRFYIESLCVYPIKSCAAFRVPDNKSWDIKREGLAWDREWCLIHQGTGAALSQKRHPQMALIRPFIDLDQGILRVICPKAASSDPDSSTSLEISLSTDDSQDDAMMSTSLCQNSKTSTVCGDRITVRVYTSTAVCDFFSKFLGVPCTLARFPPQSTTRFSRPRRGRHTQTDNFQDPGVLSSSEQSPILLSNESPILVISRSSVNLLNESIKANRVGPTSSGGGNRNSNGGGGGNAGAVAADVFRANVVVAENLNNCGGDLEQPYVEDGWSGLTIGSQRLRFDILGSCQRCQMVCIDQYTGMRSDEPFSTLAKTRRANGKILFGRHASLSVDQNGPSSVSVGDAVVPSLC